MKDGSFNNKKAGIPARKRYCWQLWDALWKLVDNENEVFSDSVHYVVDGGSLLQRLPWTKGETFDIGCERYVSYGRNMYGKPKIVCDGYESDPDTKDATHQRRSQGTGSTVVLTPQTVLSLTKSEFLSSKANKHRFLRILSSYLERAGCSTTQASGDADVLIVQTATSKQLSYFQCRWIRSSFEAIQID